MTTTRRVALAALALTASSVLTACSSGSGTSTPAGQKATEAWPEAGTNIEWIVPSAAGGGNDIMARILAPAISEELGANVQVVNREGGNQVIGLTELARAEPDGTTFGATNLPSILGRYLDPSNRATFTRESFTPIGCYASNDIIIAVPADSPYATIEDLLSAVEAQPGVVTAGTDSRAGDDHVSLATLERDLGLDLNIVHYDSGADKVAALVSGEIDLAVGGVSSVIGPWKSGDVNVLAVIAEERSDLAPDVPTLTEAGYKGAAPMTSRFCLSVPAETPKPVVSTLEGALETAMADPEVLQKMKDAATLPDVLTSAEAAELWAQREASAAPIIQEILNEQ